MQVINVKEALRTSELAFNTHKKMYFIIVLKKHGKIHIFRLEINFARKQSCCVIRRAINELIMMRVQAKSLRKLLNLRNFLIFLTECMRDCD